MIILNIVWVVVGTALLLWGADRFTDGACGIARKWHVSELVIGLTIVALIPIVLNGLFHANVSFGGTSLIIIVSVVLETTAQIDAMMAVRNYKGFLRG